MQDYRSLELSVVYKDGKHRYIPNIQDQYVDNDKIIVDDGREQHIIRKKNINSAVFQLKKGD